MTRHFFITMGLTLSIVFVNFAFFYELVLLCEVVGLSPFWSAPVMLVLLAFLTRKVLKDPVIRFNR